VIVFVLNLPGVPCLRFLGLLVQIRIKNSSVFWLPIILKIIYDVYVLTFHYQLPFPYVYKLYTVFNWLFRQGFFLLLRHLHSVCSKFLYVWWICLLCYPRMNDLLWNLHLDELIQISVNIDLTSHNEDNFLEQTISNSCVLPYYLLHDSAAV